MAPTLLWYDLETFGTHTRWDRIGQFAAIRTDYHFQEIGEPCSMYCRLSTDYVPDPDSCFLTGITPRIANERGVSEAELSATVYREMSTPNTCTLGFNTIRFDDEFIRNLFYRTFYDPYRREYDHGNSRWDILDLARMTRDLRPEGIKWPSDESGKPVFRLEELAAANGIEHDKAHDALSDVRATIRIASLIHEKQPKLFAYLFRFRKKDEVRRRLNLQAPRPLLHTSGMFTSPLGCTTVVYPLSVHPENPNAIITYDLRYDPTELTTLDAAEIRRRVFTRADALDEERIHFKAIHLNRSPAIAPLDTLSEERAVQLGIDLAQCRRNAELLRDRPSLVQKVRSAYDAAGSRQKVERDPELQIYSGGFFGDEDRATFALVHSLEPSALAASPPQFADPRGAELLRRYLARNYYELIAPAEQERWLSWCASRLLAPELDTVLDYGRFRRKIENLLARTDTSPYDKTILRDLLDYADVLDATVLQRR